MTQDILGLQNTWYQLIMVSIGTLATLYFLIRLFIDRTENTFALRNVVRNTRRSLITIIAICCAVAGNILLGNYFLDMFDGLRESTIRGQLGHVQLMKKDYFEIGSSAPTDYIIENQEEVKEAIMSDPLLKEKIQFITTELNFNGILSGPEGEKSLNYMGKAVEPKNDEEFSFFDVYTRGGPLNAEHSSELVLGTGLATQLDVDIEDYLTVLAVRPGGGFDLLDATLVGVIDTFSKEYGNVLLKTSMNFGQELLGIDGVNKIIVLLKDTLDTDFVYERIKELVDSNEGWEIQAYNWSELTDFYHQVRGMFNNIYTVVSSILFLLIIFLVLNTISMSVYERFSEFGTLRSIGIKMRNLVSLVLIEGTYLAFIGAVVGILLAYVVGYLTFSSGFSLPPPPGFSREYPVDLRIQGYASYQVLIVKSVLICIGTAFISSLIPAIRASRLKIIDCLRKNQ